MSSSKILKQRIKSVRNTSQITKAMEVVSATKMRKSQGFALNARPYAAASLEMLKNLLSRTPILPPLLQPREVKKAALLVVTSDKGLAGALNANIIRKAEAWMDEQKKENLPFTLIVVGKKARDYFTRRKAPIHESFISFGDYSTPEDTLPVAETMLKGFLEVTWDAADVVYTNFKTTLKQEAVLRKLLPVSQQGIEEMVAGILPERGRFAFGGDTSEKYTSSLSRSYSYEYKFEPSAAEILNELVPQLIRMHIHHIILESNASEHSARMVAMKSASDNAKDLIGELTLEYNKSRQAGITRELTEITAGKEALEV